jgi:hypothetical protein
LKSTVDIQRHYKEVPLSSYNISQYQKALSC